MVNKTNNHINNKRLLLRIGQINAGGSRAVTDEIRQIMAERRIDVVLLQEPYCYELNVKGFGLRAKVIEDSDRAPWSRITKIQAAVVVGNIELTVTKLQQLSNTHFICVQISTATNEVYLVSAYFQFCDNI